MQTYFVSYLQIQSLSADSSVTERDLCHRFPKTSLFDSPINLFL